MFETFLLGFVLFPIGLSIILGIIYLIISITEPKELPNVENPNEKTEYWGTGEYEEDYWEN